MKIRHETVGYVFCTKTADILILLTRAMILSRQFGKSIKTSMTGAILFFSSHGCSFTVHSEKHPFILVVTVKSVDGVTQHTGINHTSQHPAPSCLEETSLYDLASRPIYIPVRHSALPICLIPVLSSFFFREHLLEDVSQPAGEHSCSVRPCETWKRGPAPTRECEGLSQPFRLSPAKRKASLAFAGLGVLPSRLPCCGAYP